MPGGPMAAFAPCPRCSTSHVHPTRVVNRDRNKANIAYACPACRHGWQAGWSERR